MHLIDLSHTIVPDMAQWPGDGQPLKIHRRSEHGPASHMSSALEFGCHVGTHLDAALHFGPGQPGLDALPLSAFWGRARAVVCGDPAPAGPLGPQVLEGLDLAGLDFLILDTGWARHWGREAYYRSWPHLGPQLARILASVGLKGVGLDTPSLDDFGGRLAHDLCAAAGMVNLENLANVRALPPGEFILLALPLKLQGTEASPVRAVALIGGVPGDRPSGGATPRAHAQP